MIEFITEYYNKIISSSSHLVYSIICILFLTLIYIIINKLLNRFIDDKVKKKKLKITIRNFLIMTLIIVLISLWAGQIKTMVLSAAAISAAIAITFKEFILSFFASFYITSNKLLVIGDEIEYENIKGKVIDRNFSGIKIQTSSAEDNKIIFIPNLVFLTNKVMNLSKFNALKLNHTIIGFNCPMTAIEVAHILEEKLPPLLSFNLEEYKANFEKNNSGALYDLLTLRKNYNIKKDFSDPLKIQLKIYFYAKKEHKAEIEAEIFNIYYNYLKDKHDTNKTI